MSMQDPIADMLTRIRNGQHAGLATVSFPASKIKEAILNVLEAEGYILGFQREETNNKPTIIVTLKYFNNKPVIEMLKRVSRPGLRQFSSAKQIPEVKDKLGIAIVTTPKGVMTGRAAAAMGQGGEVLCYVA